MAASLFLSLRHGARLEGRDGGVLELLNGARRATLKGLYGGTRRALLRLADAAAAEGELADGALADGGPRALAEFYYYVERLERGGWLVRSARLDGRALATLLPASPSFEFSWPRCAPHDFFTLSRFAYMRPEGGELVMESPLAHGRVVLHDGAAAAVHSLARPQTIRTLCERHAWLPAESVEQLVVLLAAARVVVTSAEDGTSYEARNAALRSWEFHDLLFHARSRQGRHDYPSGGTYRLLGVVEQPPALKPITAGAIDLHRPDMDRLKLTDAPFALVHEARRSVREYDDSPITAEQLGEFLYRAARVREVRRVLKPGAPPSAGTELTCRPYPSAGGLYELELYVIVSACDGLAPGSYYYDPRQHSLLPSPARPSDAEALLLDASRATSIPRERLQVLFVVAARFPRVAWKYSSMAYAATLKNVGVLFQTMYLVAAAMNLAPCAVGAGNSDAFSRATRTDYYEEPSVGEFLLGSKPSSPEGAAVDARRLQVTETP